MSLALFYTGALKFGQEQQDPLKSTGGYISSTEIQNNVLGNLFGDLSKYVIGNNKPEIRIIAIQNIGSSTLTGLKAYFDYPHDSESEDSNEAQFEIGYADFTADGCGDLYVRKITSPYASPYNVTLWPTDGVANALNLPDLVADGYLAIYIRRILKSSTQQPLTDQQYLD
ncbi:MAG TPA: hypothetical protein VFV86_10655, partial [Nitrososphaeraceae archaeon]|nr:hypothetical protein [Nitrososphaeraceae archaeon]